MKKILMATFVVLVAGTPLAFSGTNGNNNEPDSRHCTFVGERYDLCHTDRHKHGRGEAIGAAFHHRHFRR
jgi:hypothetical protein